MKRVNFSNKNPFEFYKEVVRKKSNNANLLAIENAVEQSYILYKGNFQSYIACGRRHLRISLQN